MLPRTSTFALQRAQDHIARHDPDKVLEARKVCQWKYGSVSPLELLPLLDRWKANGRPPKEVQDYRIASAEGSRPSAKPEFYRYPQQARA